MLGSCFKLNNGLKRIKFSKKECFAFFFCANNSRLKKFNPVVLVVVVVAVVQQFFNVDSSVESKN